MAKTTLRCPKCRWTLEFVPGPGFFLAKCWNKSCPRGRSRVPIYPRELTGFRHE